jgi:hypothetical protein
MKKLIVVFFSLIFLWVLNALAFTQGQLGFLMHGHCIEVIEGKASIDLDCVTSPSLQREWHENIICALIGKC